MRYVVEGEEAHVKMANNIKQTRNRFQEAMGSSLTFWKLSK